jgi:hypothetical protein
LGEWFTSDGKLKLGVEKSIKKGRAFTIIEQHIPIQNPTIVQPIIQGFLELKALELLGGSFKVSLD